MNLFSCFQSRKPQTGSTTPAATAPKTTPKEKPSSAGSDEKHTLETIAEGPETTSPYRGGSSGNQVPGTPKSELGGYSFTPPALKAPPPVAGHKHISSPNETGSPYLPTSPSFKTSPRIDVDLESRMSTFNPYSASPPASAENTNKAAGPSSEGPSLASGLGLGIPNLSSPSPPVTPVRAHPLSNEVKMETESGPSPPVPEKDHPRTLRPKSLHGSHSANTTRQASPPKMEPIPRPRQMVDSPSFTSSYSPTMAPRISMSFARQSRLIPLDVLKNFSSDDFLGDFLKDTSFRESMDASMLSSGVPAITDRATNRQTFASSHYSEYYEDNPDLQLELSRMRSMSRQTSLHYKDSRSNRTSQYTTYNPNNEYEAYDHDKLARELAKEIEGAHRESMDPGKPGVNRLSTVAASENSGGVSVPPSDYGSPRSEIHRERPNNNHMQTNSSGNNNYLTTSHSNSGGDTSNFTHDSISTSNSMNTMSNMTNTTANTTINSIGGDSRDAKEMNVKTTAPAVATPIKTQAPTATAAPTMPPSPPVSMRESIKDLPNYTVTHSYRPILEDEIEVRRGDTVKICQEFDDGWCLVTIVKMRSDDPENRRSIGSTMGYKEGVCPRACLALEV